MNDLFEATVIDLDHQRYIEVGRYLVEDATKVEYLDGLLVYVQYKEGTHPTRTDKVRARLLALIALTNPQMLRIEEGDELSYERCRA